MAEKPAAGAVVIKCAALRFLRCAIRFKSKLVQDRYNQKGLPFYR
jgi:hypothetical protein